MNAREDILPMAEAFLEEIGPTVGRPAAGISRQAHMAWPNKTGPTGWQSPSPRMSHFFARKGEM